MSFERWLCRSVSGGTDFVRTARWALAVAISLTGMQALDAQAVSTFAGNAQHTANYQPAAQYLNRILWSTSINLNNNGAFAHYGAPLVTASNTVIVPVQTATNGFELNAFSGATGAAMYSLGSDYVLPSHSWIPVYQPVIATPGTGNRLYYAGIGGTVYYIDNPDSPTPGAPVQQVFYGAANYAANKSGFNGSIFVNTPLTADSRGNLFFGFRVQGVAPAPLSTGQSGFVRIDPSGNASYVLAGTAAGDSSIVFDSHNSAPALSNDEATLYVVVKSGNANSSYGYLLGLDSTTLATKYKVFLKDPRNQNGAIILDDSTASPTVAPDTDVYLGVFSNPDNGSRGFLLRFSSDLSVEKTPGAFGWDFTPGIVPATMVPSYTGPSTYLIFSKYNNYANAGDGNGVNRIALLDPNTTQIDPHPSANGLVEMREVLTVIGVTPDVENYSSTYPNAVREWCINSPAINPGTHSIFTPSEDGHIYRWSLDTNSLTQAVTLGSGVGEPYIPTVIGPDGTVFTLNGGSLFALGSLNGVAVAVASSNPDTRTAVAGQSITFTATVSNPGSSGLKPTGTVTFQDISFQGTTPLTTTLASNIPLDSNGQAAFTTTSPAGTHFITSSYSGDGSFSSGNATLVQRIHSSASTTALSASPNPSSPGSTVSFSAAVAPTPAGTGTAAGMVTFQDGNSVLAQIPLSNGSASFTTPALSNGSHSISATFASDSVFASSTGSVTQLVQAAGVSSVLLSPGVVVGGAATTNNLVTLNGAAPTGGATVSLSSSNPAVTVPVSVVVAAGATSSPVFTISTNAVATPMTVLISASYNGVTKTANLTVNPVALSSVALSPWSVVGGVATTNNRITLNGPAPPGGVTVTLSSSDPGVTVPASVNVPAGGLASPVFTITTSALATQTTVTITANCNGVTKTGNLTVTPAVPLTVTLSPSSVVGGLSTANNRVRLNGAAPAGGTTVNLTSSDPSVTVPASVTVAAGASYSPVFTINTAAVAGVTTVSISASYNGVTKVANLTVNPVALASVALSPWSVTGGVSTPKNRVTLNGPAPTGGATISLTSGDPGVTVPASVTVAGGAASSPVFTINTSPVTAQKTVAISASYNGVTKTVSLTVNP